MRNLFCFFILALISANSLAFGNLSADELLALISGNTAEGERREGIRPGLGPPSMVENYPEEFVMYFDTSGVVKLKIDSTHENGEWRVSKKGKLCIDWQGKKERCAHVHKEVNVYKRVTRGRFGRKLQELKFIRFIPGNKHDL